MSSWQHHQARAKSFYTDENYPGALESYTEAYNLAQSHAPRKERSILLSNIVACRLHIGGSDNLAKALEEATECISLNEKWSKGHIRLASVYIAMGNRSNDACQALQTAIRLDPSNLNSRKMLMKELRRDHISNHNHDTTNTNTNTDQSSSDERASSQPASSRTTTSTQSERNDYESSPPETQSFFATNRTTRTSDHVREEEGVDDAGYRPINGQSWVQWMYEKFHQIQSWYEDSTEITKQVVKVVFVLLVLYIAFGGRFGFENTDTSSSYRRGNYGENNAYDRFYSNSNSNSNNNSNSNSNSNRRRSYEQNDNDNVNSRYNSYNSDNDARYNSGSYEQHSNSYRPNHNSHHDHSNRRNNHNGMDYNTTAIISVVVILVLRQLGLPIHLAPAMGFGGMGMGMRRMGMGYGGFGRGRMGHVNLNGFRVPLPRHGMFGRRY